LKEPNCWNGSTSVDNSALHDGEVTIDIYSILLSTDGVGGDGIVNKAGFPDGSH
jgi:hypothetical protein